MASILSLLLACTGEPSTPEDTALLTETDTDPPDEDDTGDTAEPTPMASLTGTLTDADGAPTEGVRVNVCRVLCKTVQTDAGGAWGFAAIEAWTAMFYVTPAASTGFATPMGVLTLAEDEERVLDVVLDTFDPPRPLPSSASEVEVSDGLFLTLGADILEPAPLTDLPSEVAAVRVPTAHRLPVELDGELLDTWYLSPWEATSESGVGVRLANTWGLAPGDRARVWAASEPTTYAWLDAGELVVTEDGLMLEGDVALPILTTLALVRE
ncbi:MAG: carboxypeptidase-like regulatory domain-containing protein [Myxococcota bacterium]